ncbi:MAG: ATP-binding cassette domain-containing protein, partial [Rhodoferax sp.]|nr:ATP-binding cassette domain-containing protein [Rhodoferax sp.]
QQELDVLRPVDTPLEHMVRLVKSLSASGKLGGQATREQDLRSFLGTFHFSGDMVKQSVGSMSGGEKARLVLCMLVWQRPNLLLLDEPTNHLDLATREALSMALNEFEGTVMLVSHDRALLRAVCDEFWMVSRGGVAPFDGDLDDYQRYLLDEAKRQRELSKEEAKASKPALAAAPPPLPPKTTPEQLRKCKKELAAVEEKMTTLHTEDVALQAKLSTPAHPGEIAELGKRLKQVTEEMKALEDSWLELTAQLEESIGA